MPPSDRFDLPEDCENCPIRSLALYAPQDTSNEASITTYRRGSQTVRARQNIYVEGRPTSHIMTLFDGWAYRYRALPDGTRQIFDFLLPGDMISPAVLVSDTMPFSVDALTDCTLCLFNRQEFAGYVESQPPLIRRVWAHCRSQQSAMQARLIEVGRRTAYERLAHSLMTTFDRLTIRDMAEPAGFPFPPRHRHLADLLGLTPIHVSRTFTDLESDRVFRRDGRWIEILDMQRARDLQALVGNADA